MGNRCYSSSLNNSTPIIYDLPNPQITSSNFRFFTLFKNTRELPENTRELPENTLELSENTLELPEKKWNIMPFEKKFTKKSSINNTRDIISFHIRNMTNHYTVNYPDHSKRVETNIFRHTRKELENMPCFICGKTKNDNNISNEVHHYYIEKVATTAIDWEKFSKYANTCYNIQTGELIGDKFDWEEVKKNPDIFIDSPYNMIVLCKEHHTGRCGIHHIPFPDWIVQKFTVDGFKFIV